MSTLPSDIAAVVDTDSRILDPKSDPGDMGTSKLPGRHVLDIETVRGLSQRSDARGLLRFATHMACLCVTGTLIWLAQPHWYLMLPAMVAHGFGIVTMFAPMHECIHRTAFKSRQLNDIFGWIAGLLCFYNATYYRRYHTWHHRYTQDLDRDPELSTPRPRHVRDYLVHISGIPFWFAKPRELLLIATGKTRHLPYITEDSRRAVALSAAAQLTVYAAAIAFSVATRSTFFLYYWFLPALLAQPLLRMLLIVEHTGCSEDANGLTNTRTTLTAWPVRLYMWNMPFHAEHHLYPSIPFHQLPAAHTKLRERLVHLAPSYVAANRTVVHSLSRMEQHQDATGV
ncbi:MAG TPA: fatty acid desaturase [Pirellulales bacterium]|nr:fatty acid desaturase [Pirellulales bacterium]